MNTELSIEQQKIINAMPLVYERLVDFKIKMNSPMVIMKDDKIEYISPKELKEMRKEKQTSLSSNTR